MNGIRPLRTPPFYPASNGAAESVVALVKAGLSKLATDTITAGLTQHQGRNLQHRLDRFLLSYRCTPQLTTGIAPAEMLMKRSIRTRLDLSNPRWQQPSKWVKLNGPLLILAIDWCQAYVATS